MRIADFSEYNVIAHSVRLQIASKLMGVTYKMPWHLFIIRVGSPSHIIMKDLEFCWDQRPFRLAMYCQKLPREGKGKTTEQWRLSYSTATAWAYIGAQDTWPFLNAFQDRCLRKSLPECLP